MTPDERYERTEAARALMPELAAALDLAIGYAPGGGDPAAWHGATRRAGRIARRMADLLADESRATRGVTRCPE